MIFYIFHISTIAQSCAESGDIIINIQEIIKLIDTLDNATTCGIINHEDAEQQKIMNIEKYIKEEFSKYNVELKINYLESNKMYRIRTTKKMQDSLHLKNAYFGTSKKIVLQKLYDEIAGNQKRNITLAEMFTIWHKERKDDIDITNETTTRDLQLYNKYIKGSTLENRMLKAISIDDLHAFFKNVTKGRKISKSAFNNLKSMLNILFDYAVQDYRAIDHNIVRELKARQYKFAPCSNTINDVFTTEEIIKIWEYMINKNTVYSLACALALCLGCRIGEIKALKWRDIDFKKNTIYIHAEVVKGGKYANQQIYKEHTKSGLTEGNRELPLVDDALTTLQLIKEKACHEEFLFLGKTKKFILTQEFNDNLKEACEKLNIPYKSSHKIRKWAVTESVRNGLDEVSLMYTYGWKNRDTIEKYVKPHRTTQAQLKVLTTVFKKTSVS